MGLIGSVSLTLLSVIAAVLVAVVSRLLADDFKAWSPRLVDWLIRQAVIRLPEEYRERLDEEWRSTIGDTPGELTRCVWAAGFIRAAYTITWHLKADEVRRFLWVHGTRLKLGLVRWLIIGMLYRCFHNGGTRTRLLPFLAGYIHGYEMALTIAYDACRECDVTKAARVAVFRWLSIWRFYRSTREEFRYKISPVADRSAEEFDAYLSQIDKSPRNSE
jgi:hypothetical protein